MAIQLRAAVKPPQGKATLSSRFENTGEFESCKIFQALAFKHAGEF